MPLLDDDIAKLQSLYRSELGVEISREDAYERGIKLLRLMSIVHKPITEKEYDQTEKRRTDTLPLLLKRITNL